MPKKKRPQQFSVPSAIRANARERVGTPPPARIIEDDRARAERRKIRQAPTLARTLVAAEWD